MHIDLIESAWLRNISISDEQFISAMNDIVIGINNGNIRVAEKNNDAWFVNHWVKKAILLLFEINKMKLISGAPSDSFWYDKLPLKFEKWEESDFKNHAIRSVPGSIVRSPTYIGKNVVLMPSYVNLGAYIDDKTMIDINASVGACAQIGKRCHISGNAVIGGVIEPIQENPVIIEDDCFIGACSSITEGVIVKQGSVISSGVNITASTKIIDLSTGDVSYGIIPQSSVVIPGSYKKNDFLSINCAVIVKKSDDVSKNKVAINEILRKI